MKSASIPCRAAGNLWARSPAGVSSDNGGKGLRISFLAKLLDEKAALAQELGND